MTDSYGIYCRDTFNTCLCFFHFFDTHSWECATNIKVMVVIMPNWKYASFQTPWVTWCWEWFLSADQTDSHNSGEWREVEKGLFYFEMRCVIHFQSGSGNLTGSPLVQMHQALTMPLSSLLSSHNSFGLWGATKTATLLSHANKQPVADGAWRHVELVVCRIYSIQLMIMREMILWYSYFPP